MNLSDLYVKRLSGGFTDEHKLFRAAYFVVWRPKVVEALDHMHAVVTVELPVFEIETIVTGLQQLWMKNKLDEV